MVIVAFFAIIFIGAVDIPSNEIWQSLFHGHTETPFIDSIVWETRIPMAIAAACCGALLSVAGLMMQTVFQNPLGGPSVLGVSSGASFGVAILVLSAGGLMGHFSLEWQSLFSTLGAFLGSVFTIIVLFFFSSVLTSNASLLIVGIMMGYLFSAGISLLNYFSPADEIRNYMVWGLGSFTGLRLNSSVFFLIISSITIIFSFVFIKPLNAMLMGERFVESIGFSNKRLRGEILLLTGILVAIPTAFCGPIGFIGLIVPHLCRLLFSSSNHIVILPACIVFGALTSLICAIISVIPAQQYGVLPVNVVTPFIGVPVILYLLINRKRIPYFY